MNIFNIITCNGLIIYTKIINITSKSSSFDIIYWPVFWDAFKAYWAYYNFRIFCFKLVNFCIINKQISICPIVMQAKTIFFFVTVKLIEYIFSAISICSSPCVGPIPRTYMFFSYCQFEQKNSYLPQKLIYFYQIHHLEMKNFLFCQIQFHNQNAHIFQYLRFSLK